jgi:hypothetical protein
MSGNKINDFTRDSNGGPCHLSNMVDGKLHGAQRTWNPDGFLILSGYYFSGEKHGPFHTYVRGQLESSKYFILGKEVNKDIFDKVYIHKYN